MRVKFSLSGCRDADDIREKAAKALEEFAGPYESSILKIMAWAEVETYVWGADVDAEVHLDERRNQGDR